MKPKWMVVLAIGVLVLAVVGGGALLFPGSKPETTVSSATSPDGGWSIAVVATPHVFTGSYDMVVFHGDGQGKKLPGGMVIGLDGDLAAAERRYAISFVDNNTAKVGNRSFERPASLRK